MYMCICTCVSLCVCAPMFLYYSYLTNDTFSYKCSMSQHIFTIISVSQIIFVTGGKRKASELKRKHFLHYDTQQKLSSILNSKNGHHFCPVVCLVDFHLS